MNRPVVLSFSGHDPVGGAGLQADIETIVSHQCHAASVITTLTEQDTHNVKKLIPQRADDFIAQARTVLNDLDVKAFKIGLIGSYDIALAIYTLLSEHSAIPVILDPVLAAGGGTDLSNQQLLRAIVELLLPCTTVLTPNSEEARKLTGLSDLADCGLKLLELGCQSVLITGTHESTPSVSNQLFYQGHCFETYTWDRLPASYHGSGCTLAASIAALIAHGVSIEQAVLEAQNYTWQALQAAYQPGDGQYNPNRFFWMEQT
jgi:hydroxymethylpyrimidine/phosphomethylpyrimidine kinase